MVSEHLNVIVEAVLGLFAGVAFVVALSSFGNFLDILEKSKVLHKGPVYDVVKWTVDVVGTATGVFGFLAYQWRLIRRIYVRLRKG